MRDVKIAPAVLAVVILHAIPARYFGFWPVAIVIVVIATVTWAICPRRAE